MDSVSSLVDRLIGRNGRKREQTEELISELLVALESRGELSQSELGDVHEFLLDDEICNLIWEDAYPLSEMNQDGEHEIGSEDVTIIFEMHRPPVEAIIAKKDSPHAGARRFSIFVLRDGEADDSMAHLLMDKDDRVGILALVYLVEGGVSEEAIFQVITAHVKEKGQDDEINIWINNWIRDFYEVIQQEIAMREYLPAQDKSRFYHDTIWDNFDIIGGETWVNITKRIQIWVREGQP